jgi:hypothetical protein
MNPQQKQLTNTVAVIKGILRTTDRNADYTADARSAISKLRTTDRNVDYTADAHSAISKSS